MSTILHDQIFGPKILDIKSEKKATIFTQASSAMKSISVFLCISSLLEGVTMGMPVLLEGVSGGYACVT